MPVSGMPVSRRKRLSGLALLLALVLVFTGWFGANAYGPDEQQVNEGARLYAENCAVCHGPQGQGRVGATLAKDWPSIRPDLQVETAIRQGIPGSPMPAWGQDNGGPLSDDEIKAITAFILSWETGEARVYAPQQTPTSRPPIEPVPNVEGDPNNGAAVYDENCAVCHGPDGRGRIGAALAKDFPSIRPDLQMKNTISRGVPGSAMPAWSQDNGGPLSEAEINDVVAFVSTLPHAAPGAQEGAPTAAPEETGVTLLDGPVGFGIMVLLFLVLVGGILLAQRKSA